MARPKKDETILREAVESGDNLAILKAHRRIVVSDLISADEFSDRVRISSSLIQVNRDIIKLEGLMDDTTDEGAEDDIIRSGGLGAVR